MILSKAVDLYAYFGDFNNSFWPKFKNPPLPQSVCSALLMLGIMVFYLDNVDLSRGLGVILKSELLNI